MYASGSILKPLVLHGPNGSGKSTLATLLPKAIDGIHVNTQPIPHKGFLKNTEVQNILAQENIVDQLFETKGQSRYYFVLDEAQGFDGTDSGTYRWAIDRLSKLCLIIFTTNYPDLLDSGLKSRANLVEVPHLSAEQFLPHAMKILATEGIKVDENLLLNALDQQYRLGADNRKYYQLLDRIIYKSKQNVRHLA
jgi:replication-associated recombination protein RarA